MNENNRTTFRVLNSAASGEKNLNVQSKSCHRQFSFNKFLNGDYITYLQRLAIWIFSPHPKRPRIVLKERLERHASARDEWWDAGSRSQVLRVRSLETLKGDQEAGIG